MTAPLDPTQGSAPDVELRDQVIKWANAWSAWDAWASDPGDIEDAHRLHAEWIRCSRNLVHMVGLTPPDPPTHGDPA